MKLIVAGATGFVATEVIKQSLRASSITSVIALARRPVSVPDDVEPNSDTSKLKSVVLKDFGSYSEEDKKQLVGADACIWTLAITPTKSKTKEWEEVRRVNHDYTTVGLNAILEVQNQAGGEKKPFRFVYMSGIAAERDQSKTPMFMPQYCLMRGQVENEVLSFVEQHKDKLEACIVKPGLINKPGFNVKNVVSTITYGTGVLPSILVTEMSAAMLDQVVNGIEKDTLVNDELVKIGRQALKSSSS